MIPKFCCHGLTWLLRLHDTVYPLPLLVCFQPTLPLLAYISPPCICLYPPSSSLYMSLPPFLLLAYVSTPLPPPCICLYPPSSSLYMSLPPFLLLAYVSTPLPPPCICLYPLSPCLYHFPYISTPLPLVHTYLTISQFSSDSPNSWRAPVLFPPFPVHSADDPCSHRQFLHDVHLHMLPLFLHHCFYLSRRLAFYGQIGNILICTYTS